MDYNSEKNIYINKLDSQISGMKKLLQPKFKDIISAEKSDDINRILNKAENLRDKLKADRFEVAIIGAEKAGKSTFANALMGNDILPSMDCRCTYTSTSIRYGAEDYAEIVFLSRDEFLKKFVDNLKTMGIEHAESYDYVSLSLSKYNELFERLPDEKKILYRINVNEDVQNILEYKDSLIQNIGASKIEFKGSEQLESMTFKRFIQDPSYAIAVKEINIHSSKLSNIQNAVLYDVPGFDSPTQMHKEQTISMMSTADVILLIASAERPNITGPQVQIFESEVDVDGIPFNEKTFVFGNKADMANDAIEQNIEKIKKDLNKYRIVRTEFIDSRLVVGSARAKLELEGKLSDTGICEKLKSKGIGNGVDEIHSKLEKYNENERFEVLKKRINRIYNELEECLSNELSILNENTDRSFNFGEFSSMILELAEKRTRIKEGLNELHKTTLEKFETNPLSAKFEKCIAEFNSEKYMITEDECSVVKNEVIVKGSNLILDRFETKLRERKYDQIYGQFIKTVIDIALDTHNEYDREIKKIFIDSLSITPSNPYYQQLVDNIDTYLSAINSEKKEGYYRSLAERFATDLFETLIRPSFGGRDRWSAYDARKLNLISLGIFHTEKNEDVPVDRQPMLYSILFHDSKFNSVRTDVVKEMLDVINAYAPGHEEEIRKKFLSVLKTAAKEKREDSVEYIKSICERKTNLSSENFINSLYNILSAQFETEDNINNKCESNEYPPITKDYYDERCKIEVLNSESIEGICEHIHHDIDILSELLLKAVIPAIQLDKAFIFYIISCIENIKNSVDSEKKEFYKFDDFIVNNADKIKYGEIENIEVNEKKRRLRMEICSEIQSILDEVKIIDSCN